MEELREKIAAEAKLFLDDYAYVIDGEHEVVGLEQLADRILAIPAIESAIALYLASIEERDPD